MILCGVAAIVWLVIGCITARMIYQNAMHPANKWRGQPEKDLLFFVACIGPIGFVLFVLAGGFEFYWKNRKKLESQ